MRKEERVREKERKKERKRSIVNTGGLLSLRDSIRGANRRLLVVYVVIDKQTACILPPPLPLFDMKIHSDLLSVRASYKVHARHVYYRVYNVHR